jgi:hypothetical protein
LPAVETFICPLHAPYSNEVTQFLDLMKTPTPYEEFLTLEHQQNSNENHDEEDEVPSFCMLLIDEFVLKHERKFWTEEPKLTLFSGHY